MQQEINPMEIDLRKIRNSRDISLKDVAHHAGVSTMYISEIERDKKTPSDVLIKKLATIYKLKEKALHMRYGKISQEMQEEIVNSLDLFDTLYEISNGTLTVEKKGNFYKDISRMYANIKNH